jgi:hypothetical protein
MEALASAVNQPGASVDAPAKPKARGRVLKGVVLGLVALLAILLVSHWLWAASGSNQWKLAMDQDGVKVWTLKTPGSPLVKIKATTRVKSSLAGMVKLLEDLDSCVDANCYDGKVIESIETVPGRYAAYMTFKFDIPGLKTRQYVLLQHHHQHPVSKQLHIDISAASNRIPPDDCCVRITHLHNVWNLTPLQGGELDIEFMQDTDVGGLPYFVANYALTQGTYQILHGMQGLMNKQQYREARIDSVQELTTG